MSCNGCRVLRKGCNEGCILRPCLSWITSPESQANATLFLAKFYGRAGLLNLINAGPGHLRPEIFRSLLHEACGRIINPIYGSVGLIWSGKWEQCQAAVESVLQGSPIMQLGNNSNHGVASENSIMPLESCDIRHLSTESSSERQAVQVRKKFKRPGGSPRQVASTGGGVEEPVKCKISGRKWNELQGSQALGNETVEASLLSKVEGVVMLESDNTQGDENESAKGLLELTLG